MLKTKFLIGARERGLRIPGGSFQEDLPLKSIIKSHEKVFRNYHNCSICNNVHWMYIIDTFCSMKQYSNKTHCPVCSQEWDLCECEDEKETCSDRQKNLDRGRRGYT